MTKHLSVEELGPYNLLSSPIVVTQNDLTILWSNNSCSKISDLASLLAQTKHLLQEVLEGSKYNEEHQLSTMVDNQFKFTISKIYFHKGEETYSALLFEIFIDVNHIILPDSDHEFLLLSYNGDVIQMNKTAERNKVTTSFLRTQDTLQESLKSLASDLASTSNNIRFSIEVEKEEREKESTTEEVWYEITFSKIQQSPLLKAQYLLQCSDISKSMRTKEKLKMCTKRIEKTSDFISNLAHEIRTPLNGILGMLQYLKCSELTTEQHSCLDTAVNSSYALSHLLSDVLDLSKIEAGELSATIEPTSFHKVARLMEDLTQLYSNAVIRKGLSLYIDYPLNLSITTHSSEESFRTESTPHRRPLRRSSSETLLGKNAGNINMFYTDIMRVRQIIVNLLSNAVKYTHEGFIKLRLHLISSESASTQFDKRYPIQIEVSDSGEGISNEDLRNVFSRFKRFHGTQTEARPEGTGIGLSIVKAISERLGGTIVLDSELGKGSTFTLCLPIGYEDECNPTIDSKLNRNISNNDVEDRCYVIPSVRDFQELLSQRTIVIISRHGPNLLGVGCVDFMQNHLQTSCYFYASVDEFQSRDSHQQTVCRTRSVPLKESTCSFEALQRMFDLKGFASNSTIITKAPIDADFIFLDTSAVYDESLSVNDFLDDDLVSTSQQFGHQVSEEQHHWLRDIRQNCETIYQIVCGDMEIPEKMPNEECCLPLPQHPRTRSSLFLILPPNRAHILSHFCESGVSWYTGWLPFPFIPSRFFNSIFEAKEARKLPSPKNPTLPSQELRASKRSRSQPLANMDLSNMEGVDFEERCRILLVDDNKVNRRVAQKLILQIRPNVELDMVVNGKEAVAKVHATFGSTPYDLCLMDLRMPVLDGPGATRQIRSKEQKLNRKRLPVVALTAGLQSGVEEECFQCGMDDILCKPIIREKLAEILSKYLNH